MPILKKRHDSQENQEYLWDNLFPTVFYLEFSSILISLIISGVYILSRFGYPLNYSAIFLSLCLSWFFISFPRVLYSQIKKHTLLVKFSLLGYPFLLFFIPLFSGFSGLIIFSKMILFLQISVAVLGCISLLSTFYSIKTLLTRKEFILFILLSLILGWYLGVKVWGVEYLSPLLFEKIAMSRGHPDTVFHLALSHIFLNTGTVSTGVDGTPFIPYHAGSHMWFAGVSRLLSIEVVDVYALTYPVVIFPLLFFSMSITVLVIAHQTDSGNFISRLNSRHLLWWLSIIIVFIVGVMPLTVQTQTSLSRIVFFSESYTFAHVFTFTALPLVIFAIRSFFPQNKRPTIVSLLYLLLASIIWSFTLGYIKISHLFFIPVISGYFFVRKNSFRWVAGCIFFSSCFVLLFLLKTFSLPDHRPTLFIMHQFLTFVDDSWKGWWWILSFGWIFLAIHFDVWKLTDKGSSISLLFRERKLMGSELLLVVVLFGTLPGLFLNLPGANANYFLEIPRWLAVLCIGRLIILGTVPDFFYKIIPTSIFSIYKSFILFLLFFPLLINILLQTQQWHYYHVGLRTQFLNHYGSTDIEHATKHIDEAEVFNKLRKLSLEYQEGTLLLIDRSDSFWKLPYACDVLPLVSSALSGYPQLNGMPASHCSLDLFAYRLYADRVELKNQICPTNSWKKIQVFRDSIIQDCTY